MTSTGFARRASTTSRSDSGSRFARPRTDPPPAVAGPGPRIGTQEPHVRGHGPGACRWGPVAFGSDVRTGVRGGRDRGAGPPDQGGGPRGPGAALAHGDRPARDWRARWTGASPAGRGERRPRMAAPAGGGEPVAGERPEGWARVRSAHRHGGAG